MKRNKKAADWGAEITAYVRAVVAQSLMGEFENENTCKDTQGDRAGEACQGADQGMRQRNNRKGADVSDGGNGPGSAR